MKTRQIAPWVLMLCLSVAPLARADEAADLTAIAASMHATWDRPDNALDAGPIVVEGDHAIADWTQGTTGGRALLRREQGRWSTILCAGDVLRTREGLVDAGVPEDQAQALADKLTKAEATVAPERLARMAAFHGLVRMTPDSSAHGAHPQHHQ